MRPGLWRGLWPGLRLGLRARLLLVGVLGVATALAIGSVALYAVLTLVSFRTLDGSARATGREVATLVANDRLSDPIPVTGSQIVQVVDARDRVLSASVNADRLTAMLLPAEVRAVRAGRTLEVPGSRAGLSSPLRVLGVPAAPAQDRRTVLVAQQFDAVNHSRRILALTLLGTYPLLLAVLALIAWRVIGAALRPVETLRSSAERISGTGQDVRLPVPESRDEVHALAVTLNSMLDRLALARARQRSFVADAAHELRSPLASLQTQLEVAHRLGEDTSVTADLSAEVTRMAALVEDLLVLARLDADPAPSTVPSTAPSTTPETVDLDLLLAEVRARAGGARVPVTVPGTTGLRVTGYHDELRRALANLVDNAVRHASTAVEIAVRPTGPAVLVVVSDDGEGIASADRERVFDRFTRLDEARDRDAGGSGLGLAIVRELVTRNGGTVRLGTAPAGGLSAEVLLPAPSPP